MFTIIRSVIPKINWVRLKSPVFTTNFVKSHEKSHEKNLNCFERYDALFEIKNNFQFLVLGTPEGYPALDPFNFIKVDSKFGIMTQPTVAPSSFFFVPSSLLAY